MFRKFIKFSRTRCTHSHVLPCEKQMDEEISNTRTAKG